MFTQVSTSELFGSVSACDVPIVCTAESKATIKRHSTTRTKEAYDSGKKNDPSGVA